MKGHIMKLKIDIKFLEPFRVVNWFKKKDRHTKNNAYQRAQSFARWHKGKGKDKGKEKPYITGTLLRSAVIQAAEKLLVLSNGIIKVGDERISCCPGQFYTNKIEERDRYHLRQRTTLNWGNTQIECTKDKYCPFCELLGRFDKAGHKSTKKNSSFHVHFGNLNIRENKSFPSIETLARERVLNRVDYSSGKAHDFFSTWEIDCLLVPVFQGIISMDKNISDGALSLLKKSLRFVDQLAGAMCVINFKDSFSMKPADVFQPPVKEDINAYDQISMDIANALKSKNKVEWIRIMADVIRELRRDKELVYKLPKSRPQKNESHHIWDIQLDKDNNIRQFLLEMSNKKDNNEWRIFCENLGKSLYNVSKLILPAPKKRVLGEAEYLGKSQNIIPIEISNFPTKEYILKGIFKAKTPFYFGADKIQSSQSGFSILLDSQNQYRIPRSALRGILRRDLRTAFNASGCNSELGGRPCICPVCMIMRNTTLMDLRSNCSDAPEIRQRIRLNPFTGTVDEGALFDIEVGPEGVEFPFLLRYRGVTDDLPKALKTVLSWWQDGMAFLSGSASTGKGIFQLTDTYKHVFNFEDKSFNDYLLNRGFRGTEDKLTMEKIEFQKPLKSKPWQKVEISICLEGPFINGDPVQAMLDENSADIISFKKYIPVSQNNSNYKKVYAYKSESLRGVIRSAIGKMNIDSETGIPLFQKQHQDCDCLICKLFGSEYEAGRLRFEDLHFNTQPGTKIFDHVAIDRFTGGAVEKKKFDDCSIINNSKDNLWLTGFFWIQRNLFDNDSVAMEALGKAFLDIKNGFYPLGGKKGIGYGRLSQLILKNAGEKIDNILNAPQHIQLSKRPEKPDIKIGLQLKSNEYYYPHYFIKPGKSVHREALPISHETYHKNCFTGKLKCRIKTLTPLIIPDTSNHDYFDMDKDIKGHKSHAFFSINNKIQIPGSEIRGMISSLYETLTNSCFRILNEKYRLSWRMEADKKEVQQFLPGRIIQKNEKFYVKEMDEIRYPFYDKDCQHIQDQRNHFKWNGDGSSSYEHPTPTDSKLMTLAGFNRKNKHVNAIYQYRIIKHRPGAKPDESFMFVATPSNNPMSHQTNKIDQPSAKGYLKISGPNKLEKEKGKAKKTISDLPSLPDKNDPIIHNTVELQSLSVACGKNQDKERKKNRLVPEYACFDSKKDTTYTMNKRCERVFIEKNLPTIEVSDDAIEKFEILTQEYKANAKQQKTPEVFQTILPENGTINDGDLIYFRKEHSEAVEIIPVRISRKVDSKYIGERIDDQFRPCHREWLGKEKLSEIDDMPVKKLLTRHIEGLCPACRLFGTGSYKGRLNFSAANLENKPEWLKPIKSQERITGDKLTLPLLERPRPTWSMPNENGKIQKLQIPGRKFFVHHNGWKAVEKGIHQATGKPIEPDENNRTVQALHKENSFTFEITFENLESYELGLLIYTLQLEKGLAHKLGMAKSFGFGSIEIDIENLTLRLHDGQIADGNSKISNLIEEGKNKLCELFENEWDNVPHINALKKVLFVSSEKMNVNVCYPPLKENKDTKLPGYEEIKETFKEEKRQELLTTPWKPWHTNKD